MLKMKPSKPTVMHINPDTPVADVLPLLLLVNSPKLNFFISPIMPMSTLCIFKQDVGGCYTTDIVMLIPR
jgi:hypothetical protein